MTDKPKWTRGPLRIAPMEGEGCREIQAYHEPGHNARGRWYGIASTHGLNDDDEDAANARLWIAAPDLYDALERASEELRLIRMKDTDAVYDTTLRLAITAALARARETKP